MKDWNGMPIAVARSAGGTLLMCDTYAGLMRAEHVPWPPPALVMKLGQGDARHPFAPNLHPQVAGRLGHYCALQSINSEDAITWSFFGTLMSAPESTRAAFLNWLCRVLPGVETRALAHEEARGESVRAILVYRSGCQLD